MIELKIEEPVIPGIFLRTFNVVLLLRLYLKLEAAHTHLRNIL